MTGKKIALVERITRADALLVIRKMREELRY